MSKGERYNRQITLPEIGVGGQEKLSAARVLVIGTGGLGCPALLYLAGAGVGTIGLVDFDRVDISNLQRQVLFTAADEEKPKVGAARERLLALNPEITVNAYHEELTDKNAIGLFSRYDIVIDGTDNFSTKFLINDAAVKLGKPVIYGAIERFEGQVSVFSAAQDGPCYRCLHPRTPQAKIINCADAGVIGALAGIVGTIQAMEAIKLIIGHESFRNLSGRIFMIDSRTMETSTLNLPKRKDCPVCSHPADEIVLQYSSSVCAAHTVIEMGYNDMPHDAIFIDVREREEWDAGHIENARHLPLSALQKDNGLFKPPEKGGCCVVYCQKGGRSRKAAEILLRTGFTNIYNLKGGYDAWVKARNR